MRRLISLILFLNSLAAYAFSPQVTIVRHPVPMSFKDRRADYDKAVVQLLLEETVGEFGPYRLVPAPTMNQTRALASLKAGELVDVVATTSNFERERDFLVVKPSIHKSLMGIKIFLIRKGDEARFAKVKSLDNLRGLIAGQGQDWPDAVILRDNHLRVDTAPTYEGLFKMLETQRFDYFPRSLPEVFDEAEAHPDLAVESELALVYPMDAYLFVNKGNMQLYKRLQRGFELALQHGTFEKLFLQKHAANIQRANLKKRRLFYLTNPLLSPEESKLHPDISFVP